MASSGGEYEPAGFIENWDRDRCRERLSGLPVYWIDNIAALAKDHWAVCSLATTKRDKFIEQVAALGIPFATIVHSTAHVSSASSLGEERFSARASSSERSRPWAGVCASTAAL